MKFFLQIVLSLVFFIIKSLHAQVPPSIEWQKSLGGSDNEFAWVIQPATDGFIIAGSSDSEDGDVSGNHGNDDYWIVKLNNEGSLNWQKSLGGSHFDRARAIQQVTDGGFIVAGFTRSDNGDITENFGVEDWWVTKLDDEGNLVWGKSFGGSWSEHTYSVRQTADNGFIIAGSTSSADGDISFTHGDDMWIVKLDVNGNLMWERCFGGSSGEEARSIQQTQDEGFIIAGSSYSNDGDVTGNHGETDFWIVKLTPTGNLEWQKSLGGSGDDRAYSVQQTFEGGFIVAGKTESIDGDVSGHYNCDNYLNCSDYWIVKLDLNGNIVWQKCLGGNDYDEAASIQQTFDGGFVVAGSTKSNDGDITVNHGGEDFWIVKLDIQGNLLWQLSLGGSYGDQANSIHQTSDGGFAIAGWSSSINGDVSGNHGNQDSWIVKLTSDTESGTASLQNNLVSYYPNPAQNQLIINLVVPINQVTIHVFDVQGRMIELPKSFTNTQAQLTTMQLPEGFYTLQIINTETGKTEIGKFVKTE